MHEMDDATHKAFVREACNDGMMYSDDLTRAWLFSFFVTEMDGTSFDVGRCARVPTRVCVVVVA